MASMGITRIANVTGLDRIGLPVVAVMRPNARSLSVAQGKGVDLASAKASGLMESIETYHAEHILQPLKFGSVEELRPAHRLIPTEDLPRAIGRPFHQRLRLHWIEGRDISNSEPVWVPYELVHTAFSTQRLPGSGCFRCSSNGLASGNDILEATVHGICEVVERDAVALWILSDDAAKRERKVFLDSVRDPLCVDVILRIESAELSVHLWDVTSDVGIPTFVAMIAEGGTNSAYGRERLPHLGSGCHIDSGIAVLRALTEAAQTRLTVISGARDDLDAGAYAYDGSSGQKQRYDSLEQTQPKKNYRGSSRACETFEDDIDLLLSRLQSAGMSSVVVADLTRAELGVPVVKVIVPGLEGGAHHPNYVRGRRAKAVLASHDASNCVRRADTSGPGRQN